MNDWHCNVIRASAPWKNARDRSSFCIISTLETFSEYFSREGTLSMPALLPLPQGKTPRVSLKGQLVHRPRRKSLELSRAAASRNEHRLITRTSRYLSCSLNTVMIVMVSAASTEGSNLIIRSSKKVTTGILIPAWYYFEHSDLTLYYMYLCKMYLPRVQF